MISFPTGPAKVVAVVTCSAFAGLVWQAVRDRQRGKLSNSMIRWLTATTAAAVVLIYLLAGGTTDSGQPNADEEHAVVATSSQAPATEPAPQDSPPAEPEERTQVPETPRLPQVESGTVGELQRTGTYTSTNEHPYYDLDRNRESDAPEHGIEIGVFDSGISSVNSTPLSVYEGRTDPILADCAAISPEDWVMTVPLARVTVGAKVCIFTTVGHFGYFTVQEVELTSAGDLGSIHLTTLLWQKLW